MHISPRSRQSVVSTPRQTCFFLTALLFLEGDSPSADSFPADPGAAGGAGREAAVSGGDGCLIFTELRKN